MQIFKDQKKVIALISNKKDKSMKLREENKINREEYFKKNNISFDKVVSADLVHGNRVQIVTDKNTGEVITNTDGLVTNTKGVYLTVTIADCLPIYLYDPQKEIVGILHAGWKSIIKRIPLEAVIKFTNLGSDPKDIKVFIGPGISKCHFEVEEEVIDKFYEYPEAINDKHVDLKLVVQEQLKKTGVKDIEISKDCTYCDEKYFSYRRDKKEVIEAMIAVIGINPY